MRRIGVGRKTVYEIDPCSSPQQKLEIVSFKNYYKLKHVSIDLRAKRNARKGHLTALLSKAILSAYKPRFN